MIHRGPFQPLRFCDSVTQAVSERSEIRTMHVILTVEMQLQGYYKQDRTIFIQLIITAVSEVLTFWSLIY